MNAKTFFKVMTGFELRETLKVGGDVVEEAMEGYLKEESEWLIADEVNMLHDDIVDILRQQIELSLTDNYKSVYIDGFDKCADEIIKLIEIKQQ